jgi:hypothetical protein
MYITYKKYIPNTYLGKKQKRVLPVIKAQIKYIR